MSAETLIERLRRRAEIRRQIPTRKSVQTGERDRLAELLDEAAAELEGAYAVLEELTSGKPVPLGDILKNARALLKKAKVQA